jgi:hypothetical protein
MLTKMATVLCWDDTERAKKKSLGLSFYNLVSSLNRFSTRVIYFSAQGQKVPRLLRIICQLKRNIWTPGANHIASVARATRNLQWADAKRRRASTYTSFSRYPPKSCYDEASKPQEQGRLSVVCTNETMWLLYVTLK